MNDLKDMVKKRKEKGKEVDSEETNNRLGISLHKKGQKAMQMRRIHMQD